MKTDIVLAGVGGQGILSIAATIGMAALHSNLQLKQSEVHGMSQRGGAVQSHMRVSDKSIASDLIPMGAADIILSVEPMESLRYLPFLSKDGWLVTNSTPFINITNYPKIDDVLAEIRKFKNHILIDADKIAEEFGSKRSSNIVMLGAASPFFNIPFESFEEGIRKIFGRKGDDIIETNLKALRAGREFTEKNR
ncbi:MAG: indolepyruvate oxidoreductase subunit beta [Bacteroidales bacterium]|jgi:indolepyruvate ferredoxin oxidoreductase beta subunit|nr:indolepyruvate oxidoreductase subunit beta [Bacteroidales bacterium]